MRIVRHLALILVAAIVLRPIVLGQATTKARDAGRSGRLRFESFVPKSNGPRQTVCERNF